MRYERYDIGKEIKENAACFQMVENLTKNY